MLISSGTWGGDDSDTDSWYNRAMLRILDDLFGPGTWGTGGNMVAWIICGCIGFGWLHSKEKARHLAHMDKLEQHHKEVLEAIRKGQPDDV